MKDAFENLKERVACAQIRVSILALVCLVAIAVVAMVRLDDPENIIINIVLVISGIAGITSRMDNRTRKEDKPKDTV